MMVERLPARPGVLGVVFAIGLTVLIGVPGLRAQEYELSWTSIDGGGGVGGDGFFAVESTVGQPESAVMSDGFYRLEGGFWPAFLPTPPSGTIDPTSAMVEFGGSLDLTATPAGSGPFRYQWRLNGVNLADQTNRVLNLTNIQLANLGSYTVVIVNETGVARSDSTIVTGEIRDWEAGDNFADAVIIPQSLPRLQGRNIGFTLELNEPWHGGKLGGSSGWYSWTAPSNGIATFTTKGGAFDTLLAIYTGKSLDTLLPVGSDDDRGGYLTSEVQCNVVAGETYFIAVDGLGGRSGVYVLSWVMEITEEILPVLTNVPASRAVPLGGATLFSVTAKGSGLSYQWYFNGNLLSGEIANVLMLDNVQAGDVGYYTARVTNADGRWVETLPAALEIGPLSTAVTYSKLEDLLAALGVRGGASPGAPFAGPSNLGPDPGAMPVSVGPIQQQQFENVKALTDQPCPTACGEVGGAAQWMALLPDMDGVLRLDTVGSDFDTVIYVFEPALDICDYFVACDSDGAVDGTSSAVEFSVQGGRTYIVVVDGENGEHGMATLNVQLCQAPPPFAHTAEGFFLLTAAEPAPFPPDSPVYTWLRDGIWYAETDQPVLSMGNAPESAAHFSVYYESLDNGEFNVVTNDLGAILAVQFGMGLLDGLPVFNLGLPGIQDQPFQVERADPNSIGCDHSWLWLLETNYTVQALSNTPTVSLPAAAASGFYRIRPVPVLEDSP